MEIPANIFKPINGHDAGDEGVVKTFILTPVHPQSGPAANPKHNLHAEEGSHFLHAGVVSTAAGRNSNALGCIQICFRTRVSIRTNRNIRKKKFKGQAEASRLLHKILQRDVCRLSALIICCSRHRFKTSSSLHFSLRSSISLRAKK